jgi:protein O-GlcNAc transferase
MKPTNRLKPAGNAQALLARAVALHQSGQWTEAGALYEQVLRRQPGQVDALHLLGLVKGQVGDLAAGIALIQQAVRGDGRQAAFRLNLGRLLQAAGRATEAARAFGGLLALTPDDAEGVSTLADALYDGGQPMMAARWYGRAAALDPSLTTAAYNRGAALRDAGRTAEALAAFHDVLAAAPLLVPAQEQITGLRHASGDVLGATSASRRLLALVPDQPDALAILGGGLSNPTIEGADQWETGAVWLARAAWARLDSGAALALAALLLGRDRPAAAVGWFRRALALAPDSAVGLSGLGLALAALGRGDAAVDSALRAVRLDPASPAFAANAGAILHQAKRQTDAGGWHRRAVTLDPDSVTGWINIGAHALEANAFEAAIPLFARVLALGAGGDEALVRSNLGVALMALGRHGEAVAAFRAALERVPGDAAIRSNLLFCLCFTEDADLDAVFAEHRAFERFVAPTPPPVPNFTAVDRNPDRRLRVGYLSPDFQRYPGPGYHFLLPLIDRHDRAAVEVTCYYNDTPSDAATARFKAAADRWRDCAGLSDQELAARIRADGIDILVDCDGHMSRNRMTLFLHRPAPVQISLPLYPNSTGLSAMDYQLADPRIAPDWADGLHSERLIRLPGCVLCYRPADSAFAPPDRPPVERTGVFTFGSFNNVTKVNGSTIALWARLLIALPQARLLLKWRGLGSGGALDQRLLAAFAAHGVGAERLVLRGITPDPYEDYTRIDCALDPVFANGGTTICDALWMGVPVLNQAGRATISRWGASLLGAVGLGGLVTESDDDYLALGVRLATDRAFLDEQRADLRGRMARSALMDEGGYARAVEAAYRAAWRRWSAGLPPVALELAPVAAEPVEAAAPLPPPPPPALLPGVPADALRRAERILVIKLDELGDFVLATPFLRGLRASAPQARIHLVVSDNVVPLTEGCPHMDAVVSPVNGGTGGALNFRGRSPADLQRFAEDFRAGFDIAVTARFDFDKGGAATLAAASRAPIRLAHTERATPWKETGNRGFDAAYTHVLPAGPARHEVDSNLALLAALGGSDPGGGVELYPNAAERAVARALLAGGFDGAPWSARPCRLLAVAPSTASDRRNYPLPSLAALVNRLAALAGFDGVVLLGVRDDAARAASLAAALAPPVLDLTGAADLRALTALLAEVDAVVAMDSGPAHMAAAVGTPVAALSCHPQGGDPLNPHAPDRFRPWGDAALVIQPPRAAAPCLDGCRAAEAHCIAGIDAASSAAEIARFFQNRRAQGDADPGQGEKPRP